MPDGSCHKLTIQLMKNTMGLIHVVDTPHKPKNDGVAI